MRGLSQHTRELIEYAYQLLAHDHPMTLRQLHYRIFSSAGVPYANDQASYKRLSRATTSARRAYREWQLNDRGGSAPECSIPPTWMVDETREAETVNAWKDCAGFLETVKRAYRRDAWQSQPSYCEVWSEKATVLGAIRPIVSEYGITVRTIHGYSSTGMEMQTGALFAGIQKPISVFYLGDHDPSGIGIERDIHERAQQASGITFSMERLAIFAADIRKFKLPPQRIKASDTRASSFRKRFGSKAATVELDALPPTELRRRVRDAITGLINFEAWERELTAEEVEAQSITRVIDTFKNLPQMRPEHDA